MSRVSRSSSSDLGCTQPLPRPTSHGAQEHRAAQLACADAVLRGIFPKEELPDCLAMLGLEGKVTP